MTRELKIFQFFSEIKVALTSKATFAIKIAMSLLLCITHGPAANADAASCLEEVLSYVAEVDQLLAKEKDRITPFEDLNKRTRLPRVG